jgi:hypothetical protein
MPEKRHKHKEQVQEPDFDYKNLKKLITNIVASEPPAVEPKEEGSEGE